ncbi:DUF3099 domain-containing protein [Phytohabitans sp. ZYX-F-186]|uniref:DUF3099 domain-containing protein n=1 Tax=Phytohabitans maris TaxID=3071409 RepID=A0ABU0ZHG4_9ACTN|nr:DUF3099 domain-containing protein [Phytohabitans sp. ZYX-F-186]MDQ7906499.1 DUF3099 domain-containing protein [Phytohabitans sp. ZYX-F-186]
MRRKAARPILITDADRSQADQLRSRQVRYVLMMSVRGVCLLVAAILVGTKAPLLWLWLPLCLLGMVLIPWLAVLLANDRPPKEQYRFRHNRTEADEPPQQALPDASPPKTIDAD